MDADEDDDGVDDVKQGNDEKDNRMKDVNFYLIQRCTYLIFVTGTTGGACVKKLPGVNFYRFNAKNWQFTV